MKSFFVSICLLACACASPPEKNRVPAVAAAATIIDDIPSKDAFKGWRDEKGYASGNEAYDRLKKIELKCEKPMLYPTHPSQMMKRYHVFKTGTYDHFKLRGDDEACKIGAKKANGSGKLPCFMPETLEYAVVSDVYEDECGNMYRAYHEVLFLKKNETMGSLFSVGRASFQNPKSQFDKDMIDGHTYGVNAKEFVYLTDLLPGEADKARELRGEALSRTHRYDGATHTFQLKEH